MSRAISLTLVLFSLLRHSVRCDTNPYSADWINPTAASLLTAGQTVTIQWTSRLWQRIMTSRLQIDSNYADLWACAHNATCSSGQFIAEVNVSGVYSVEWNVPILDLEPGAINTWILVFAPDGEKPAQTSQILQSDYFRVSREKASVGPFTSSVQSTVSYISYTSSTPQPATTITQSSTATVDVQSTSDVATNTSSSSPQSVATGLTRNEIGAVAAGCILGSLGLIALGWALAHWRKSRSNIETNQQTGTSLNHGDIFSAAPTEKPRDQTGMAHELVGSSAHSYQAHQSRYWDSPAELNG